MEIIVVMAQRKCDYPGQYGPEALACMSEYEFSDNPGYLHDARLENMDTGEFDAVELVTLKVPDGEIDRRLSREREPIEAEAVS